MDNGWSPSVPSDEEIFVPTPIPIKRSHDPFAGKCIHGNVGARLEGGVLINPSCEHCQKS